MAKYKKDAIIIESAMDLESEMCRFNCHTLEELEELLWNEHSMVLVLTYKR